MAPWVETKIKHPGIGQEVWAWGGTRVLLLTYHGGFGIWDSITHWAPCRRPLPPK